MERWTAELVLDAHADLGEGPLWDARTAELLWVDIMAGLVHRFDPATGADSAFDAGRPVGAVVPRAAGGYALAVREGFARADDDGAVTPIASVAHEGLRMNDGACDSRGRFWAGTMHLDGGAGGAALYRLDASGAVETMLRGVSISNGIAWSPDDTTMYYVDTPTQGIDAFDYHAGSGAIANRRRLATIEDGAGSPDGLVVDADGCIWVALWDGGGARRYSPEGEHLGTVDVPAARVTKPAFGGDDLGDLYLTTAAPDGGVYRARPGVRGLPARAYAG